jgi:hypothetical protein
MEWRSLRMNDWSNDNLAPGDLVHVYNRPGARPSPQTGIVISLNKPSVGSLQIYDAQVLIEESVVNVYRHDMYRITDDGIANFVAPSALSGPHGTLSPQPSAHSTPK